MLLPAFDWRYPETGHSHSPNGKMWFTFHVRHLVHISRSLICNSCFRSLRSNNKKPASKQLDQESVVGNFGTAPCNSLVHLRQFRACIQTVGRCGYIFSNALQSTSILRDTFTVDTDFCWNGKTQKPLSCHSHTLRFWSSQLHSSILFSFMLSIYFIIVCSRQTSQSMNQ